MCYSAQIIDGYKQYVRHWGAEISMVIWSWDQEAEPAGLF